MLTHSKGKCINYIRMPVVFQNRLSDQAAADGDDTVTDDECLACSGQDVVGHERPSVCAGVLFWSCADCGFTWPRFTNPISSGLVQASIEAAEQYEPHSRRSDR